MNDSIDSHHHNTPSRQLPNEIVLLIIQSLSDLVDQGSRLYRRGSLYQCALVSKQFHTIANPFVWRVFGRTHGYRKFFMHGDPSLQQRRHTLAQHIRELYICDDHFVDWKLGTMAPHMPHVTHLTLTNGADITDHGFLYFAPQCQHLVSIKLFAVSLTYVSFETLAHHCCNSLREIDWSIYDADQSPEWLTLFASCPLQRLRISSWEPALTKDTVSTIQSWHQLISLDIFPSSTKALKRLLQPTATPTTTLTQHHWPQLTTCKLNSCDAIDDTTLTSFFKSHGRLQVLHLHDAKQMTDKSLVAMALYLPQLTQVSLSLANISSKGIRHLVRQCRGMERITLKECRRVALGHFDGLWESKAYDGWMLGQQAMDKIRQD